MSDYLEDDGFWVGDKDNDKDGDPVTKTGTSVKVVSNFESEVKEASQCLLHHDEGAKATQGVGMDEVAKDSAERVQDSMHVAPKRKEKYTRRGHM